MSDRPHSGSVRLSAGCLFLFGLFLVGATALWFMDLRAKQVRLRTELEQVTKEKGALLQVAKRVKRLEAEIQSLKGR